MVEKERGRPTEIILSPAADDHTQNPFQKSKTFSNSSSVDSESSHRQRRLNMPMMYQMYESQYEDLRGTVYGPDSPDFFPVQAGETLRKALSGIDTKDQVIINTVLFHNNFQRQKILSAYEDMYERKLLEDLEEETGGYFLELALALFKPAHQYDTQLLYKSLSNRYGDRSIAVEFACTRTAKQLKVIRETFNNDYRKALEKDIAVKVEGLFGRMLAMLLCRPRDELHKKLDDALIEKHAQILLTNSIDEISRNLTYFEELFVKNTWKHINAVLNRVDDQRREKGSDIETLIRKNKNIHSDIRLMLLTIVRVARNAQLYFAEKLRAAMSGERADNSTIIRIAVTRSEIDLNDIAEEYKRKYHRSLELDIQQTCSGDYLRLLTALISGGANHFYPNNL